jgi:regulator of sirC expression with transglutaminase-like and TPR domain
MVDKCECESRIKSLGMKFDPELDLSPVSNRQFLVRLLTELKALYVARRDVDRAIRTIARLTLLDPDSREDCRDLASVLSHEGDHESARQCLRSYLALNPEGVGADEARAVLCRLLELRASRN